MDRVFIVLCHNEDCQVDAFPYTTLERAIHSWKEIYDEYIELGMSINVMDEDNNTHYFSTNEGCECWIEEAKLDDC